MVSGKTQHRSVIQTFRRIKSDRETVQLRIAYGNSTIFLYFADGYAIFTHPSYLKDKLGNTLVVNGKITSDQVNKALIRQQELAKANRTRRIGTILVEMGYITKRELQDYIEAEIVGVIKNTLEADDATIICLPDMGTLQFDITATVDIEYLMENTESAGKAKPYGIHEISPDDIFTVAVETAHLRGLTTRMWKIVVLLDGKRTIVDLSHISNLSTRQINSIVESLLERKFIKHIETEPVSKSKKLYIKMGKPVTSVLNRVIGKLRRV